MSNRKSNPLSASILVFTALIWGTAFVFQSEGGTAAGPFTFAAVRAVITTLCLLLTVAVLDRKGLAHPPKSDTEKKDLLRSGIICGFCLYLTTVCQQLGMYFGTPVGKAGFLTACYVVLVPVIGLIFGRKCSRRVLIAVLIAVTGLYFLCISGSLTLNISDLAVFGAAVSCAVQITVIDRYIERVDPVWLSLVQFAVSAALGIIPMTVLEILPRGITLWGQGIMSPASVKALLYTGVVSGAGGYTLQIVGQRGCEPATASILMSLESVFSVLAGWVLLNQVLSVRELFGCGLIFLAVILAQLPEKCKPE